MLRLSLLSSTRIALHAPLFLCAVSNLGCYLTHERRDDAGARSDVAVGDTHSPPREEAVLALVDGDGVQLVMVDGSLGARLAYGDGTIVHLRSEGTQMGGVTHHAGRLMPIVFDAFGALVRSEETSTVIDLERQRRGGFVGASAFYRGDYAYGVTDGILGRREALGGVLTPRGLRPWNCVPYGISRPFGDQLAVACPGGLQYELHILRDASLTAVDLSGAGIPLPRRGSSDNSVFYTSRDGVNDVVLFRSEDERVSLGDLTLVAESNAEVVARVSDQCVRRVDKRSGASRDVCRTQTIRSAAVTEDGELFVVEGDSVRTLVRVRDEALIGMPAWSVDSQLIAAGNTLAFRSRSSLDAPEDFVGARESFVWLIDATSLEILFSQNALAQPRVRLSRDGRFALFAVPWVGRGVTDATWVDLQTGDTHAVQARRTTSGASDDFAFFHGPDVVMPPG